MAFDSGSHISSMFSDDPLHGFTQSEAFVYAGIIEDKAVWLSPS
jgi:hypothetical protein